MKKSIQIAGAYIGLIVGAGFASGQEILQFFTTFGLYSFIAVFIAFILFSFLGMQILELGSELQTWSHKQVIDHICGPYLGRIIDLIITFFLFGVATVMIAGSGSIFEQQFGISPVVGALILTVLVLITLILDIKNVISIISSVTPFLLLLIFIIAGYSIFTSDLTSASREATALAHPASAPHWILGGMLYVSYNIAAGVSMLAIIGGTIKDKRVARRGGVLGGIGLGLLLLLINLSLYMNIDKVKDVPMPTLFLANDLSPVLGWLMALALLGMIYNTAVAMLYSFTARFFHTGTKKFKVIIVIVGLLAFGASFVGFTELVGTVYPITGYLGFILMMAVLFHVLRNLFRKR